MRARGFSLIEVMVAVAILGFALTAILSAQAGLFSSASHAQRETVAIGLARCKMGDIEERMLKFGYPEIDTNDDGQCCPDGPPEDGMHCSWKIQRVELPQPPSFDSTFADAGSLFSSLGASSASPMGMGAPGMGMGAPGMGAPGAIPGLNLNTPGAGAIGALMGAGANDAGALAAAAGDGGGVQALSSMMSGATAGGGVAGLAPMVMGIVYPSLKPMLEASIRKIVLTVDWREGLKKRELTVVQYVTNPMKGGILGIGPMGSAMPGMPGMPGGTGFGPGSTPTGAPNMTSTPGLPKMPGFGR
jgi:general secretion pathway protein I